MKRNVNYGQKTYPMGEHQYVGKIDVSQGKLGLGTKGKPRSEKAPSCGHYGVIKSIVHGHHDPK